MGTNLLDLSAAGLCGRDTEIRQLHECVERVVTDDDNVVEIVSIQGEAGAGKSCLAQHAMVAAEQSQHVGLVCGGAGKFEEFAQEPFWAIMRITYCRSLSYISFFEHLVGNRGY